MSRGISASRAKDGQDNRTYHNPLCGRGLSSIHLRIARSLAYLDTVLGGSYYRLYIKVDMDLDRETRVEEFKTGLEADLASVEAEFASLKANLDRLARERDGLQQLIEDADRYLSSIRGDNRRSGTVVRVPPRAGDGTDPASSQESTPATNGLPENPTRRQVVLKIVPRFHGRRFTAGDIRHRFVQDYLDGKEPENFPQAINNLLKRMAKKGEIKNLGRQYDLPGAPYMYQENQEGILKLEP